MKKTPQWQIFREVYLLMEKYYDNVHHTDESFSAILAEANKLYDQYRNTPQEYFAGDLIRAISKELERISAERKK